MKTSRYWMKAANIASIYAAQAHLGQTRKDGVTPYIVHPARVAGLVTQFGGSPTTVIAAWFHDVVEDCQGNPEEDHVIPALKQMEIGPGSYAWIEILDNIRFMTKDASLHKKERESEFLSRLEQASAEQGLLKVCDRIDNLLDAPNCQNVSKTWAEEYFAESENLLQSLPTCVQVKYPEALALLLDIILNHGEENGV